MTLVEARDILVLRVAFQGEGNSNPILVLDASNSTSESGRFFEEEFNWVSLTNISQTMTIAPADVIAFNAHLFNLRKRAAMHVLSDVFFDEISDDTDIDVCKHSFDSAISKRMALLVAEQIFTTTRKNFEERVGKDYLSHIYMELSGNEKENLAEYNEDYPTFLGLKSRYGFEIKRLKDRFDTNRMLSTNTIGLGRKDELFDREYIFRYY